MRQRSSAGAAGRISLPPDRSGGSGPRERAVLLTRPLEDSRRTAGPLEADGIPCEIWPLTEIRPVTMTLGVPATADALLITSAHGARAFCALSDRRDLPALCVGTRTAAVARGLGLAAMAAGPDAAALARFAIGSGMRHFFHPRGRDTATDLAALLAPSGQRVTEAVLYAAEETGPPDAPVRHALASGRIGVAGFWSARAAAIFARHRAQGLAMEGTPLAVAISTRAAEPLSACGFAGVRVAARPDGAAMLACLRDAAESVQCSR